MFKKKVLRFFLSVIIIIIIKKNNVNVLPPRTTTTTSTRNSTLEYCAHGIYFYNVLAVNRLSSGYGRERIVESAPSGEKKEKLEIIIINKETLSRADRARVPTQGHALRAQYRPVDTHTCIVACTVKVMV